MLFFNRWIQSVKSQDIKFFFSGLLIVLVIEIAIDTFQKGPGCSNDGVASSNANSNYFGSVDLTYAKRLASTIHVYCFILTEPSQYPSQYHAQNTWIRRCTSYGFVSYQSNRLLRLLNAKHHAASYQRKSWNSMRVTLRALYDQPEKWSFYFKADYDNYIVMENVRYMLESENPELPFILGRVHQPGPHGDKLSNSVGYVLSRKALELIVTKGLDHKAECSEIEREEDVQISLCAEAVGVQVRDKLDFLGKSRFSNVTIFELLGPYPNNTPRWYPAESDYTLPKYDLRKLPASPLTVSFSGINATMMYVLEYLLYHLRPTGISYKWMYEHK